MSSDGDGYGDDFEDYDEDFEDFENEPGPAAAAPRSHEEELRLAIARENQAAQRVQAKVATATRLDERVARPAGALEAAAATAALPAAPAMALPSREALQAGEARRRATASLHRRVQELWPRVRPRLVDEPISIPEDRSMEMRLVAGLARTHVEVQVDFNHEKEVRTEDPPKPEFVAKQCQAPEDALAAGDDLMATAGGPSDILKGLQRRRRMLLDGESVRVAEGRAQVRALIRQAGSLVCRVLEARRLKEASSWFGSGVAEAVPGGKLIPQRVQLVIPPALSARRIAGLALTGGAQSQALALLEPATRALTEEERLKDHTIGGLSIIAVWAPSLTAQSAAAARKQQQGGGAGGAAPDTRRPRELLACEGTVTCGTWGSEGHESVIVAGTEEGAVYLWDLAAPPPAPPNPTDTDPRNATPEELALGGGRPLRRPASSTIHGAGFFVHGERIVSVAALAPERRSRIGGGGGDAADGSKVDGAAYATALALGSGGQSSASRCVMAVVVLDASSRVSVWDVREGHGVSGIAPRLTLLLAQPAVPLGRAAGRTGLSGPVETYRSSSSTARGSVGASAGAGDDGEPDWGDGGPEESLAVALGITREGAQEHLLVASSSGRVFKGSRQGSFCPAPWEYEAAPRWAWGGEDTEEGAAAPRGVSCLDVSPLRPEAFAAATEEGVALVFGAKRGRPAAALVPAVQRPPLSLFWSRVNPGILALVDDQGDLTAWEVPTPQQLGERTSAAGASDGRVLFAESVRAAAGLKAVRRACVAPRAPVEGDLIAVSGPDGTNPISLLLLRTPAPLPGALERVLSGVGGGEYEEVAAPLGGRNSNPNGNGRLAAGPSFNNGHGAGSGLLKAGSSRGSFVQEEGAGW